MKRKSPRELASLIPLGGGFVCVARRMPVGAIDEDGLPKNPDLQLMQWRFLLMADETMGINKDDAWENLLRAVKENGEWMQSLYT